jgi:mannose-1-phosphate guanylyltransferase
MVNVAYHHQFNEEYFGDGSCWGVEIGCLYEDM